MWGSKAQPPSKDFAIFGVVDEGDDLHYLFLRMLFVIVM